MKGAGPDWLVASFRFDDGDRNVRFVEEQIIDPLLLSPGDELAPDDDPAISKGELPTPLILKPAAGLQGWRDEPVADIRFTELRRT